jgi:branched-chain amino acid transport system permease protein
MSEPVAIPQPRTGRIAVPRELIALAAIGVLGIAGYLIFPEDLAFLTRLISLTLLVLSLDLVTGFCGVATLGHAALFGVAAYVVGNVALAGFADPLLLLLAGAIAGGVTGLLSGALVTRYHGLPQLVLSIAIGQLVAGLSNKLSAWTGGSDGLSGITPGKLFGMFGFDMYSRVGYIFSAVVLAIVFIVLQRITASPFGLLCRGIKDDNLRARMIGAPVYPTLVAMYGISGIVAGIGGALMAINTGVIGLDSVAFERSAETLVMLVLGGAGQLWGALFGGVLFQLFEHFVSAANPFHWMTFVGVLLIAIVLFAPKGLVPALATLGTRLMPGGRP